MENQKSKVLTTSAGKTTQLNKRKQDKEKSGSDRIFPLLYLSVQHHYRWLKVHQVSQVHQVHQVCKDHQVHQVCQECEFRDEVGKMCINSPTLLCVLTR